MARILTVTEVQRKRPRFSRANTGNGQICPISESCDRSNNAHYHCSLCEKSTDRKQRAENHFRKHVNKAIAGARLATRNQDKAKLRSDNKRKIRIPQAPPPISRIAECEDAYDFENPFSISKRALVGVTCSPGQRHQASAIAGGFVPVAGLCRAVTSTGTIVDSEPKAGDQVRVTHDEGGDQPFWYATYIGRVPPRIFEGGDSPEAACRVMYFDLASVEDDGSLLYKLHREYIIQFDAIVAHGRLLVPDLRYPRAPMMRLLCDTELLRQDEADDVADSRRQSFLAGLPEYLKPGRGLDGVFQLPSLATSAAAETMSFIAAQLVLPTLEVDVVNGAGSPCKPNRCSLHAEDPDQRRCNMVPATANESTKVVFCVSGPHNFRKKQWVCTVHAGRFVTTPAYRHLLSDGLTMEPCLTRLGQKGIICTVPFIVYVFLTWVNCRFVVAASRRAILTSWQAAALDRCGDVRVLCAIDGVRGALSPNQIATVAARRASCAHLVPTQPQLTQLVGWLFHCHIKRQVLDHCALMQLEYGQVVRYDCTFAVNANVSATSGPERVKMTTCVMTVTGRGGELIDVPRPLPSESMERVLTVIRPIVRHRISVYGDAGTIAAYCTDDIRRDGAGMLTMLSEESPAVVAGRAGVICRPGVPAAPRPPVAGCQDVIHARWRIERAMDTNHVDYLLASRDVQATIGRCVYPHPPAPAVQAFNIQLVPLPPSSTDQQLAMEAVAVLHQGAVFAPASRAFFTDAIATWQWDITRHPLWLTVTTRPPPHCLVQRLAYAVLGPGPVQKDRVEHLLRPFRFGFHDAVQFRAEIESLQAWYSVTRAHVVSTHVDVVRLVASSLPAPLTLPHGSLRQRPAEPLLPIAATVSGGVLETARARLAITNITSQVTVDGLLANGRLGDLPKGTSHCEAVHAFLERMIAKSTICIDTLEIVLSVITVAYNQSKLRRDDLSNTFARDRVYATIAATYERLFASALSEPAVLVHALDTYVHSPPRSVDQLRAAGYSIALSKKDPFASDHHDAVINAIARVRDDGAAVMGSYKNVYRWISQSVLGNARTEAHVKYYVENVLRNSASRQYVQPSRDDDIFDDSSACDSDDEQ